MDIQFNLAELNHFSGSDVIYQHWINSKFCYTEGVNFLAKKADCYWLIEEIGLVLLPRLLKDHNDWFYSIQLLVKNDLSAVIAISDGNGKVHLEHVIKWTDFPVRETPVLFYLCDSGSYYCLMLPSEY